MTSGEFEKGFLPVVNRWKTSFSGDQLRLVRSEVDHLTMKELERISDHVLSNFRQAPLPSDIQRLVREMGFIPRINPAHHAPGVLRAVVDDYDYCIRDNIWANNDYIFIRGETPRQCGFIIKKDQPNHPLVLEDAQVRTLRISEVKKHLANGTYSQYFERKKTPGLELVKYGSVK